MIILLILVVSVLIALLRGGRLSGLNTLPIRHIWLFFVPFALQLVLFTPLSSLLGISNDVDRIAYPVSMLIATVVLWLNRQLPGVMWIVTGLCLNLVVITVNGGFMPVSNAALEFAGMSPLTDRQRHGIPMTDATVLPWLGDVVPFPPVLPLKGVFSIGDILIVIGGVIFIQRAVKVPVPSQVQSQK